MQKDMHYYGTYAMARAAGIRPDASKTIATCAQFVDDNAANTTLKFDNGAWIESVATAHHTIDKENLNLSDQRRVWIPFHFLPGNVGNTWTEKLKCRKDSMIVKEMIAHHMSFSDKSYALELMGISAHVYADTFAHYGFSGISSRGNRIVNDSLVINDVDSKMTEYIDKKLAKFKGRKGAKLHPNFRRAARGGHGWWAGTKNMVVSWFAETLSGALGHGSVATFPDRPYLNWEFTYENPDGYLSSLNGDSKTHAIRPNPETFLEGCEKLHGMFVDFRNKRPAIDNGDARDFETIREKVAEVLLVQAEMKGRIDAWQDAAADASVFGNGETIPPYEGEAWNEEWNNLDGEKESDVVLNKPIWHFYQAAAMHRTYVLRDLLPSHKLIVD